METEFEAIKEELKERLGMLLAMPSRNGDEIVVPTGSSRRWSTLTQT